MSGRRAPETPYRGRHDPGLARTPQRVLISYAHDWDEPHHAEAVRQMWEFLRAHGIDARLDLPAAERRQDWSLWMADEIRAADVILIIASHAYRARAEGRSDPFVGQGVQWEARLIRDAFYRDQRAVGRFVPVVLPGQSIDGIPDFLAPNTSSVYYVAEFTTRGADRLLRLLTGQPMTMQPPLGRVPELPARPESYRRSDTDGQSGDVGVPGRSVHNEITGGVFGTVIQVGNITGSAAIGE